MVCAITGAGILLATAAASASNNRKAGRKDDHRSEKVERSLASANSRGLEVNVENFGKVTDFFYRGAQPKGDEYNQLASLGVKTIVDLRNDPRGYAKSLAERAGLAYINLPMSDKDYPLSDAASKFLTLINDQANWPVFVHCAGGRHRTGAMTAVYRMSIEGWDVDRAYEEMKDYDFYTRWGHKSMKQYVFDYYRDLLQKRREQSPIAAK
jgi:protein tyrosine/serine phosphatase